MNISWANTAQSTNRISNKFSMAFNLSPRTITSNPITLPPLLCLDVPLVRPYQNIRGAGRRCVEPISDANSNSHRQQPAAKTSTSVTSGKSIVLGHPQRSISPPLSYRILPLYLTPSFSDARRNLSVLAKGAMPSDSPVKLFPSRHTFHACCILAGLMMCPNISMTQSFCALLSPLGLGFWLDLATLFPVLGRRTSCLKKKKEGQN
jgi:hypothetical protein